MVLDVPGATSTEAHDVNDAGQIVGTFRVPEEPPRTGVRTRCYVVPPPGVIRPLGSMRGGKRGLGVDMFFSPSIL
jgi:hypothetical protein